MNVICISKGYVRQFYNGNAKKAVDQKDGIVINDENIISAFYAIPGTADAMKKAKESFKRYISDNKSTTYFFDYEKNVFL